MFGKVQEIPQTEKLNFILEVTYAASSNYILIGLQLITERHIIFLLQNGILLIMKALLEGKLL